MKWQETVLPKFPRTKHLPFEPNASREDLIATEAETKDLLGSEVWIEEKLDGANCGITIVDGKPVIRNRNHVLSKAYAAKTPAKKQFASIWNWFYENKSKFETLAASLEYIPSVYGEWMYATHSLAYTRLPDLFVAFEIYGPDGYLPSAETRRQLQDAGFSVPPLLHAGMAKQKDLLRLRSGRSEFGDVEREGICIKSGVLRYKMVRQGFVQGENWNKGKLRKNEVAK